MDGEEILKSLLNRPTESLYEATDAYLNPLRSVLGRKNGFKGGGSKSGEETVTKYCTFCAKYLRCVVEALKKCKESGSELEQLTRSMKLVTKALDAVIVFDNGRYLKLVPSLDQLGRMLFHIVVQLLNKLYFQEALQQACYLLKYIQLSKKSISENLLKEVNNLALHMSDTLWKGAIKMEQLPGSIMKLPVDIGLVLQWRKLSLQFASEGNTPIESHVERILKAATKFQKDSEANNIDYCTLSDFLETTFRMIMERTECLSCKQKLQDSTLNSIMELGFHCGRVCQKSGRTKEALTIFSQLQNVVGRLSDSSNDLCSSNRKAYTCICLACKAAVTLNSLREFSVSKENNFEAVDEILHDLNERFGEVLSQLNGPMPSLIMLSDSLEYVRSSLQNASNKQVDRTKGASKSKQGRATLPHRTFHAVQQLFACYVKVLECLRSSSNTGAKKAAVSCEQVQKSTNRQLAVLSFMACLYQNQIQQDGYPGAANIDTKSRQVKLATSCLCVLQQTSALIHSALLSQEMSVNELKWLAFDAYNLGCLSYKNDWFSVGADLLSLACKELRNWCFAVDDGEDASRVENVKLLSKYSLLADCQRRGGCCNAALSTVANTVALALRTSRDLTDGQFVTQQVKLWISTKHELIGCLEQEEAEVTKTRTLLNGLAELEEGSNIDNIQLALVLEEELACYKSKRYSTDVEQAMVARQLVELYSVQEDWLHHAVATLELALAISHSDAVSAMEYCEKSLDALQKLLTNATEEDTTFIQEKLAAAHLWLGVLRHQSAVRDKSTARTDEEEDETEEETTKHCVRASDVEEHYVVCLHSALELWTSVIEQCSHKDCDGQIDLSLIHSPQDMCFYLETAAALYGLVNQPLNRVRALHLSALVHRASGTPSGLDAAVMSYSQAACTLCSLMDVPHASMLLECGSQIMQKHDASPAATIQFLLSKSQYLLTTGKFTEGESCLKEALESDFLSHKTATAHLLHGRLNAVRVEYLIVPSAVYQTNLPTDPDLGRPSALDVALDGLHKFRQLVDELFGQDDFNNSHSKTDVSAKRPTQSVSGTKDGAVRRPGSRHHSLQLSVLCELLSSCIRVGQLYADQGATKEALAHFSDGLKVAKRFSLPYRIADFLTRIAHLEMHQGKLDEAGESLEESRQILDLPAGKDDNSRPSATQRSKKDVALLLKHSEVCHDLALRILHIRYALALSVYLAHTSNAKQSISVLEVTDNLCASAETWMTDFLDVLSKILELGGKSKKEAVTSGTSKDRAKCGGNKKKPSSKASKERKQKSGEKEAHVQSTLTAQALFSPFNASVYALNADLLIQSGKHVKAQEFISGALEVLEDTKKSCGTIQVSLFPVLAKLHYLSGLMNLLSEAASGTELDSRWTLCGSARNLGDPCESSHSSAVELSESEKPRKATRRKPSKSAKTAAEDAEEKSTQQKNERRTGKKPSTSAKTVKEDAEGKSAEQKNERGTRRKPSTSAKTVKEDTDGKSTQEKNAERGTGRGRKARAGVDVVQETSKKKEPRKGTSKPTKEGPSQLEQATLSFERALELFQANPQPSLFSQVCQSLALCYGRTSPRVAANYLNLSMAITLRHQSVSALGKRIRKLLKETPCPNLKKLGRNKDCSQLPEMMESMTLSENVSIKLNNLQTIRESMLWPQGLTAFKEQEQQIIDGLPKEWTVCTLTVMSLPGGHGRQLVLSRLRAGCEPILLKLPIDVPRDELEEPQTPACEIDSIVMNFINLFGGTIEEEFENIMSDSSRTTTQELSRQEWWTQRTKLDERLKCLLQKLEDSWLGAWKGVLLGRPVGTEAEDVTASVAQELQCNIKALVGQAPDAQLLQVLLDSYAHLTKTQIKKGLSCLTGCENASASLDKVLDLFEAAVTKVSGAGGSKKKRTNKKEANHKPKRHPVILILHKEIQQLSWENLPILREHPVTRVPSLQFLHSQLQAVQTSSIRNFNRQVDPVNTYYILNPQNNLDNAMKMFKEWFESEDGWKGVAGKAPSHSEFSSALKEHDLFIYFGHGSGSEFLKGTDIQRLDCRAISLVMGCSSGKLQVGGECEPRGMALNYLLAGCPAIVGNLWDVTDRDIDRFSEALLKTWLQSGRDLSLPEVISQSRQACKMQFLIGAAPVVYGIPVYLKE